MRKYSAVIAGNGPSLARIDYARLPQEFDVYRCNQFYFEEKYYLGKRVQGVLFHPDIFYEQYYTLKNLEARGEYEFEEIYCNRMFGGVEVIKGFSCFNVMHPGVLETYKLVERYPKIHELLRYRDLYFNECPTSGVMLLLIAAIRGYKEMHLIGIDFYEGGDYAFEFRKSNIMELMPSFKKRAATHYHSKELDLKIIALIQEYFDLKLYSLSLDENSMGLQRSPIVGNAFILEDKPQDSIEDIMIPPLENPYRDIEALPLKTMKNVHMELEGVHAALEDICKELRCNVFKRWYLDMRRIFTKIFCK